MRIFATTVRHIHRAAGALALTASLAVALPSSLLAAQSQTRWVPLPVSKLDALSPEQVPADTMRGAQLFAQCAACHEATSASHKVGPSLAGIVARPAAAFPDYAYSAALAGARREGLVWSREFIDSYLQGPTRFLAGNKMPFIGIAAVQDRRDLLAYLATLPAPATASWLQSEPAAGANPARTGAN